MNKIAIVVGGTGLVGKALVNQLVNIDHISEVITLTRSPAEHSSSNLHKVKPPRRQAKLGVNVDPYNLT